MRSPPVEADPPEVGQHLAEVHQGMFFGSRAVRALAHALTHTVLATAVGLIVWAFWRAAGRIREQAPSAA